MKNELEHMNAESIQQDNTTGFGMWMYLMTDFVLFASFFAVYAVLHVNTAGGVSASSIFSPPYVLIETLVLLTSSFVCGLALNAAKNNNKLQVVFWLSITAILGSLFVTMEFSEFGKLIESGNSWQQSGFLSSYFALVGTHGLHIIMGLLWVGALMISIANKGLTRANNRKLMLWSMFWHFLDVIWIFIFTIVYLLPLV